LLLRQESSLMADNFLYYGDNLDILRRYIADESVDLVYLDPPFKSDQNTTIKSQKFHIVAKGETLGSISSKYYGSSGKWRKIYDNNRDIIKDPNVLKPGTKLMLPD